MKITTITKELEIHLCINMSLVESRLLFKGWLSIIILTKHYKTCFVECHKQQIYENLLFYIYILTKSKPFFVLPILFQRKLKVLLYYFILNFRWCFTPPPQYLKSKNRATEQ